MKPGKLTPTVILGQPWQRTYNAVLNWKWEGINFEVDGVKLFSPFLGIDYNSSSSKADKDEDQTKSVQQQVL